MITVKNLSYTYMKGTPYEKRALDNVSVTINAGEYVGIIGATGSGKSTFIQHLNGLIKLQSGSIEVDDIDLSKKKPDLRLLRRKVGMVFQYPESQLFANTVLQDVCFGPKNMKKTQEECEALAKEAIELVGLDFDKFSNRSPFELSGGEKRRVAIAGVIACKPEYLILDEPSAGLDPKGKEDIYALIWHIKQTTKNTVIIISHDVDEVSESSDRIIVFCSAKIAADFKVNDFSKHAQLLKDLNLDVPATVKLQQELKARGVLDKDIELGVKQSEFVENFLKYER